MMSRERSTYKNLTLIKLIRIKRFSYLVGGVLLASLLALVPYKVHASSPTYVESRREAFTWYNSCDMDFINTVPIDRISDRTTNSNLNTHYLCGNLTNRSYGELEYTRKFYHATSDEYDESDFSSSYNNKMGDVLTDPGSQYLNSQLVDVIAQFTADYNDTHAYFLSSSNDQNKSLIYTTFLTNQEIIMSGWTPNLWFSVAFSPANSSFNSSWCDSHSSTCNELRQRLYNDTFNSISTISIDLNNQTNNFVVDSVMTRLRELLDADAIGQSVFLNAFVASIPHYSDYIWRIASFNNIRWTTLDYNTSGSYVNNSMAGYHMSLSSDQYSELFPNGWHAPGMFITPYYNRLSDSYTQNQVYRQTGVYSIGSPHSFYVFCSDNDTECLADINRYSSNISDQHGQVGEYIDNNNPAFNWFNVFGFNLAFPFTFLFTSFSNNACVSTPTINSWLHRPTTDQYCNWWPSDVRNTLTPVFMLASTMLLFGFIISWLRDSDAIHDSRKEF